MTREEREKAIKALKWFKEYNEEDYCGGDRIQDEHGNWYYRITEQDFETFDMIIKALEQGLTIDKIRAAIEQEYRNESEHPYGQGLRRAIEIIDNYKTETEE